MNLVKLLNPQLWYDYAWEVSQKTLNRGCLAETVDTLEVRWPSSYSIDYAGKWMQTIEKGLSSIVKLTYEPLEQPETARVLFEAVFEGNSYPIVIDYSDYAPIDEELAKDCFLYFKMQYKDCGYPFENVVPGGFIPASADVYSYLHALRKRTRISKTVYGKYSVGYPDDLRTRAISLLKNQSKFSAITDTKVIRYSRYLREASESAVCLDLPGRGDFCFRLIDYLAIGSFVIAVELENSLHAELEDRKHVVFAKRDLSDLLELCEYYLEHSKEREEIARNGAMFFDNHLHYLKLAEYYVQAMVSQILDDKLGTRVQRPASGF